MEVSLSLIITVHLVLRVVAAQVVTLLPSNMFIASAGGTVAFLCSSPPTQEAIVSANWTLNGTPLEDLNIRGVTTTFDSIGGSLRFTNLPEEYNQTSVGCIATLSSGGTVVTATTLLLIQGLLPAVGDLTLRVQNSRVFLNWTAPFTLDIETENPDIDGYCIDVVSSTSPVTLLTQCGVNINEFSFPLPQDAACHIYSITVTPVNVVGQGERNSVSYAQTEARPELMKAVRVSVSSTGDILTFLLTMSAPVCAIELTFVDLNTGEINMRDNPDLTVGENNITVTTEGLAMSRHYSVTVRASNALGSATSYATISTHDLESFQVVDGTGITVVYSEHSVARGALFSFVFITNSGDVEFNRSALLVLSRNTSPATLSLYPGHYRVYAYDIEHDGTLSSGVGYPAVTEELFTDSPSDPAPLQNEGCQIISSNYIITAHCSLSMATGFQMIAQLSEFPDKLYVNQSMDLQTPVTVQVERAGDYEVSVFAISEGTGILDSVVEYREAVEVSMPATVATTSSEATTLSDTTATTALAMIVFALFLLFLLVAVPCVVLC